MLRWRFSTGLLLGLLLGLAVGALLASMLDRAPTGDEELRFQLRQLSREIEREKEARARADRQLQQFTEFANQMTESFRRLEARFEQLAQQAAEAAPGRGAPPDPGEPSMSPTPEHESSN